jgi:hypothetical protein
MKRLARWCPQIGERVFYEETLGLSGEMYIVRDVAINGIPSCREPMVKLEGKAGFVLASHCSYIGDKQPEESK